MSQLNFNINLLNNQEKIRKYILNNNRLAKTNFYIDKIGTTLFKRESGTIVPFGNSISPQAAASVAKKRITVKNRNIYNSMNMKLVDAFLPRYGNVMVPCHKIGPKRVNLIGFLQRFNDNFADTFNSIFRDLKENGREFIQLKLKNNNGFETIFGGTISSVMKRTKVGKNDYVYYVRGSSNVTQVTDQVVFIKVIEQNVNLDRVHIKNLRRLQNFRNFLTSLHDNYTNSKNQLLTNVAYKLNGNLENYGTLLFGEKFSAQRQRLFGGSPNDADIVFYKTPFASFIDSAAPNSPTIITIEATENLSGLLGNGIQQSYLTNMNMNVLDVSLFAILAKMDQSGRIANGTKSINKAKLVLVPTSSVINQRDIVVVGGN